MARGWFRNLLLPNYLTTLRGPRKLIMLMHPGMHGSDHKHLIGRYENPIWTATAQNVVAVTSDKDWALCLLTLGLE